MPSTDSAPSGAQPPTPSEEPQEIPCEEIVERYRREADDASLLLQHAVGAGASSVPLTTEMIQAIVEVTAMILCCYAPSKDSKLLWPSKASIARFELAFHELSAGMAPVTADSLRDTSDRSPRSNIRPLDGLRHLLHLVLGKSLAYRFSRTLTIITIFFMGLAIYGAYLDISNGPIEDGMVFSTEDSLQALFQILLPFTYGGMGACVYLLRSLHKYIYERSFDRNRRAEYYNRILLGVVSGGTITLVASNVGLGDGDTVTLSASALGFIAGYNTDLLFSALERLVAAILPKIDITSIKASQPQAAPPLQLTQEGLAVLVEKLTAATDPKDKDVIAALIEKIKTKL